MIRRLLLLFAVLSGGAFAAQQAGSPESRAAVARAIGTLAKGDAHTARVELLNAVKADPGNALAAALEGRVLLDLRDGPAAQASLDRAAKLGMKPARLNHLFAHAALLQGRYDDAIVLAGKDGSDPAFRAYAARIEARAFAAKGDFGRAGAAFDRAIRAAPQSSALWSDVGRFRMMGGDMRGALDAASEATRLNPSNVDAIVLSGELLRQQYGLVVAIPGFERALEIDRAHVPAMTELAATLGDAGRNQQMLAMTRRIIAVDPKNPQAFYLQAVMAARANKPDLARSLLYRTNGSLDGLPGVMLLRATIELMQGADQQAINRLRPLVELQPANVKARRLLGAALWRLGDYRATVDTLAPLARRADADSYTLTILGRTFEALGDRTEAGILLDRAAQPQRADPVAFGTAFARTAPGASANDASIVIPQISTLIANGQHNAAIARATALQRSNPGAPDASVVLGDAYGAAGRWNDAVNAYRVASNIRFAEPTALRLVRALERGGRGEEAVSVLDTFITQNPRSLPARMLMAELFMRTEDWSKAIAEWQGLRERIGNRDAAILNNLAWCYLQSGDEDESLRYADAAFRLARNNPAVLTTYGQVLTKAGGSPARAVAVLEKAVAIAPQQANVRIALAEAYASADRKADARAAAKAALALPGLTDREAAQALLRGL